MKRTLFWIPLLLIAVTVATAEEAADEFILTLKPGQSIDRISRGYGVVKLKEIDDASVYLIRQQSGGPQNLQKLQYDGGVESLEVNVRINLDDSVETLYLLDDSAETLYLLDTRARSILNGVDVPKAYAEQPALSLAGVTGARSRSTGAATRVAYIDTGVDFNHPALRPWLDPGVDLISGRSASEYDGLNLADSAETLYLLDDGTPASPGAIPAAFGHGTLVAGVIHAVAPDAVIVPLKAFDASGHTTMYTVVEAVHRSLELNVDVLNMSFSTGTDSRAFRAAVDRARAAGIAVVSSVGNGGRDAYDVFPAAYTGVFGVAATDFEDRLAPFSNFGRSVSISAPGAYVISTAPGGRYAAVWGTSFSAPVVSGSIALLASLGNRGSAQGQMVITAADSIDARNPGFEKLLGTGRVNVLKALERR